jgi:hypothetical protein
MLAKLAINLLGLLRQFEAAMLARRQQPPAFRQVILQPPLLGVEEPLDVCGVAAVLAALREQIVIPNHAVGFRQGIVEYGRRERNAALAERAPDLMPVEVLTVFRFVFLTDL